MSPHPPTPDQLAACRDVLLALARSAGPWPTNDPLLAEVATLCGQVRRRATRTVRSDHARRDADVRDRSGLSTGGG